MAYDCQLTICFRIRVQCAERDALWTAGKMPALQKADDQRPTYQWPTANDQAANDRSSVSRAQQVHIQPNCSRHASRQLAEECVSGVNVRALAVLRPQQPAFQRLLAWIMR